MTHSKNYLYSFFTTKVRTCRMCYEDDKNDELLRPCLGKGTMKYVHTKCWKNAGYHCTICSFTIENTQRLISRPMSITIPEDLCYQMYFIDFQTSTTLSELVLSWNKMSLAFGTFYFAVSILVQMQYWKKGSQSRFLFSKLLHILLHFCCIDAFTLMNIFNYAKIQIATLLALFFFTRSSFVIFTETTLKMV